MAKFFAAIEIKGIEKLEATLREIGIRVANKWSRGAVAEGANVVRDKVRANAVRVGLSRRGLSVLPSGGTHNRRGRIPQAVYAYVKPAKGGGGATAVVGIKSYRGRYQQTFHWRWLEFGSIHNAPTPFFRPGFTQSRAQAKAAMEKVYRYQIAHAGRFKK